MDHCNISDLTAAGIGHCVNKHILVFNTTNDIEPVTVYCGNYFDKTQNVESEIPIILAYDGQALHGNCKRTMVQGKSLDRSYMGMRG